VRDKYGSPTSLIAESQVHLENGMVAWPTLAFLTFLLEMYMHQTHDVIMATVS
jgi:hypothetical protein